RFGYIWFRRRSRGDQRGSLCLHFVLPYGPPSESVAPAFTSPGRPCLARGSCHAIDEVSEVLVESGLKEAAELGRCPELGNRVEVLECRRECVGQAPNRAWLELLVLRIVSANLGKNAGDHGGADPLNAASRSRRT